MHQYSHHTLLQPFFTFFNPISSVHEQFTRAETENKIYIPKFSTARFQKSFKYQVAKMWYSIPTEIKQLTFHNLKLSMIRNYLKAIVNLPILYYHRNQLASNFFKNNGASSDFNFRVAA